MGRAAVRTAAQSYLATQEFPFVGTVFPSRPLIVDENDYDAAMSQQIPLVDTGSSAVLIVNIPNSRRQRQALTGRAAVNDTGIHSVALELFFANTSGDAIQAQADNDTAVDAIVVAIRKDPLLGTGATGSVWSAGEFQAGIDVEQHEPFTSADALAIFIPTVIRFESWEWIAGTGV